MPVCGGDDHHTRRRGAANRPSETAIMIRGEDAGAHIDLAAGDLTIFEASSAGIPHFADASITTRDAEPHRLEQRHFIETIQSADPLAGATVEQALTVQRVIEMIHNSHDQEAAIQSDIPPAPTIN